MYFFANFEVQPLISLAVQFFAFSAGGFLLVSAFSMLEPRDRFYPGITLGLILFIVLANIFSQLVPIQIAFPAASAIVFLSGAVSAFSKRTEINWRHSTGFEIVQAALFVGLMILFILINRGLAILDDYHNLPIVSIMATGRIPPPFYLQNDMPMAYHYGMHVFAAFLVAEGNFFPWSAFDISKSLVLSLTVLSAWTWFRIKQMNSGGLLMAVFIFALAGGTRWLLLFAPAGWLQTTSSSLNLLGGRVTSNIWLTESIASAWNIEGGGIFPFPFAYANGIFHPVIFSIGSNSTLPVLTIILLLLILPKKWTVPTILLFSLSIASLGLSAELYAGLIYLGAAFALPAAIIQKKDRSTWLPWFYILGLAGPFLLLQGGVLSEVFRSLVLRMTGGPISPGSIGAFSFTPVPTVISAHLGLLPLTDPNTAILALVEIGPVLLLIPYTFVALKRSWQGGSLLTAIVLLGSYILPVLSIFLHYSVERDTARLIGNSGFLWMLAGLPVLFGSIPENKNRIRTAVQTGTALSTFGGIVFLAVMLTTLKSPVQSYFLTGVDARFTAKFWNKLEEDAQIFDPVPYRAVTIFGRISDTNSDLRTHLASFNALLKDPTPRNASAAGFDYYYLDNGAWQGMSREQQQSFQDECVLSMKAIEDELGNLRILYDISACR